MNETLFELLFIKPMKYEEVAMQMNITIQAVRDYYNQTSIEKSVEIDKLRRIRSLFNNKNNKPEFYWKQDFPKFYAWYLKQEEDQHSSCYYCKTEEFKIRELWENDFFKGSKQMINRGRHLEIERKDSEVNDYSPENCVLACYFCNNDKSDVISEKDYFRYFAAGDPSNRKRYIDDKYNEMQKSKKG